jgi:hypothetical protein
LEAYRAVLAVVRHYSMLQPPVFVVQCLLHLYMHYVCVFSPILLPKAVVFT